jgi:hypothetical protein
VRRLRGRIGCALGFAGLVACCTGVLAGCSSAQGASSQASCGTTQTGAGVQVVIKVEKGNVDCGTALNVENQYAAMIRAGDVKGNGGGAPVSVSGWTCQGNPTPELLRTGDASQCHSGSAEIVAVLPSPGNTPTAPAS